MRSLKYGVATLLLSLGMPFLAHADIAATPDGGGVWQQADDSDGPRFEVRPDGGWRIYSQVTDTVTFPDRQGIQDARIVAEEKAKANIVSFIEEHIAKQRLASEVSSSLQHAEARREQKGKSAPTETVSKDTQRLFTKVAGELEESYSNGTLRGVRMLQWKYEPPSGNQDEGVVVVQVGISNKTMNEAKMMQRALQGDDQGNGGNGSPDTKPGNSGAIPRPGAETHKMSGGDDW